MVLDPRECPDCGRTVPYKHLADHRRRWHSDEEQEVSDTATTGFDEGPKDDAPKARRTRLGGNGRRKGAHSPGAARRTANVPALKVQLQIPYKLAGQVATSRGLPHTGAVLDRKAPECAAAWDQFLQRWPALYEALEKGMIAGDVIALIMVHMEILQVARMELAARQQQFQDGAYNPDANVPVS
jgi:hypothetical protein